MKKNSQTPIVSIIVPVYNVEKYINQCIESVLDQTFESWELILINDGSSDKSQEICEYYAKLDDRIKVVNKINEGVGKARNDGILKSLGIYLCFLDSDDWLTKDALEISIKESNNYTDELIQFGCIRFIDKNRVLTKRTPPLLSVDLRKDDISSLIPIFNTGNAFAVWGKLIKKSSIIENNIWFGNKKRGEDIEFTIKLYHKISKIRSISNHLYNYRVLYGIASKYDPSIIDNHIENYISFYNLFKVDFNKKIVQEYLYKLAMLWFVVVVPINISSCKHFSVKIKRSYFKKVLLNSDINSILMQIEFKPKTIKYFVYNLIFMAKSSTLLLIFSSFLLYIRTKFKLTN